MREKLKQILLLCLALFPGVAWPQTNPVEPIPVAILRFVGEDEAMNDAFRSAVYNELRLMNYFTPAVIPMSSSLAAALPPDQPPPLILTGRFRYVMGGAFFTTERRYHFQLWLWDMEGPTLIYTNEIAYEDITEGWKFLPKLIQTILHVF